jgi:hypothetical protein
VHLIYAVVSESIVQDWSAKETLIAPSATHPLSSKFCPSIVTSFDSEAYEKSSTKGAL